MDFGFSIPTRGPLAAPQHVVALARKAEELGFTYVGVPDHVIIPRSFAPNYPYSTDGDFGEGKDGNCLEQIALIAFLAGATSSLRFVTSVMVVPHRNPILTAKMLATIDIMSGGRITVGCGAGWLAEEIEALNTAPYAERGRVTDEYIAVFRELWCADNPSFEGAYARFSNIIFSPKPVQKPHPPIWTGGESPPALRRAGRVADTWYPIGNNPSHRLGTPALLAEYFGRVKKHAEDAGREPESISLAYAAGWYDERSALETEDGSRLILTGEPEQIAGDIVALGEVGVKSIFIDVLGFGVDSPSTTETAERMDFFTSEIRPLVG